MEIALPTLEFLGLDPGIDHLLALECIHEVKALGGRVTSFESFCGGLPAPEFSDNPLRYKFSWSPRNALLNTIGAARYLHKGQLVQIEEGGDLMKAAKVLDFLPGFNLEGFPNRDSTAYGDYYGIPEAKTILRGTFTIAQVLVNQAEFFRYNSLQRFQQSGKHPASHRPSGSRTTSFASQQRS